MTNGPAETSAGPLGTDHTPHGVTGSDPLDGNQGNQDASLPDT